MNLVFGGAGQIAVKKKTARRFHAEPPCFEPVV
jgi:hypothetical protein